MTITLLNNSNSLAFLKRNKWSDELSTTDTFPNVVLLSSWEESESDLQEVKPLVEKLIDNGCKYFVCAGRYSEALHDFIDDVILDMALTNQHNNNTIITTWHNTDTDDEVSDFFLHSTNVSNGLLVAFINGSKTEDMRLKKAILSLARSDQRT